MISIKNKYRELRLTIGMALGMMLNPLNTSMIAVALNRLQSVFHLTYSELSWIIASYYLASAIAQPVLGKIGDQIGRRRLFFTGLFLITISSLCAPFSPSYWWLLQFRIIQAIGTSSIMPNSVGIIRSSISGSQVKAMATISVIVTVSAAFGPFVGGVILELCDWPGIFTLNFPFLLSAFILSWRHVPADNAIQIKNLQIDIPGLLLFSGFISALLLFFISLSTGFNWLWLLITIPVGIGLYYREISIDSPFINIQFLMIHLPVSIIYLLNILANVVFYSILFGVPSFLQQVRHFSSLHTGLVMLPLAGFGLIITPLTGRWINRKGSYAPLFSGGLFIFTGLIFLQLIDENTNLIFMTGIFSLLGIGNALYGFSLQMALYEHIRTSETGIAMGLFMTTRFIGTVFCSSLLSICFGSRITILEFHNLAVICSVIVLIIICIIPLMYRLSKQKINSESSF